MQTNPSAESDEPLDLGLDGESQYERLRAFIEHGQGFELYFCGFDSRASFSEVKRRLAEVPPPEHVFEELSLEGPEVLRTIAERLAATRPAQSGRKIVFAAPSGWEEDLKAEWSVGLRRFNERRNITIRDCPNAIVIAGPSWLPWLAHDQAPDLWSVRTAVFTFPRPPASRDIFLAPEYDEWSPGLPMAHELQPPAYYEELAEALEAGRNPGEQETRGRLLLRACAAWQLKGDYDRALLAAERAREVFVDAHEDLMIAVAMGRIADILQRKGDIGEALRIRQEEQLPVYERLGDERERAVTMVKIADILALEGETEEAFRIWIDECLPIFQRIGDLEGIAAIRFACARARLHSGGLEHGEAQTVLDELKESFGLCQRLRRPEGIAAVGRLLGPVLLARGHADEALNVLDQSAVAFEKLDRADEAAMVRELQQRIRDGNE